MDKLLKTKEVSELLSISEKTLANARWSGVGISIPYVKLSNSVRYKQSDVEAYIEANIHRYKINDRFSIDSDKHNWMLIETITTEKSKPYSRHSYYATLKQLSRSIIDRVAKGTLSRLSVAQDKNTPSTKRINFLIDNIVKDLELFLQGVTSNEKA